MDDDVKQLKERADEWRDFALRHLITSDQLPEEQGLWGPESEYMARIKTKFVFPNLEGIECEVAVGLEHIRTGLEVFMKLNWNDELIRQMEQTFCGLREDYERTAKQKMTPLQQRYVEQVLLTLKFPEGPS